MVEDVTSCGGGGMGEIGGSVVDHFQPDVALIQGLDGADLIVLGSIHEESS